MNSDGPKDSPPLKAGDVQSSVHGDFHKPQEAPFEPKPETEERREKGRELQTWLAILTAAIGLPGSVIGLGRLTASPEPVAAEPHPTAVPASPKASPLPTQTISAPAATPVIPPTRSAEELDAEREKLLIELRAAEPRFDITYLSIDTRDLEGWRGGALKKVQGFENLVVARSELEGALPQSEESADEIYDPKKLPFKEADVDWSQVGPEALAARALLRQNRLEAGFPVILGLVLKQKGLRDAEDVEIVLQRVALPKMIPMEDFGMLADDAWLNRLIQAGATTELVTIKVNTMVRGDAVLIPLAVCGIVQRAEEMERAPAVKSNWRFAKGPIFLPASLRIADPLAGKKKEFPIRRSFPPP